MIFDTDITRRSFIGGTVKTGAILFLAPAIVRAESLMKIWVPGDDKIITDPNDYNFLMEGFANFDQVFVKNEMTGEVLINEVVHGRVQTWNIKPQLGQPLNVAIRRQGCIDYIHRVGSPYPGCKTKIRGINLLTSREPE